MVETTVHVHSGKLEIEIKDDKVIRFTLKPDDALNFGIKLLRAAYAIKASVDVL